MRLSNVCVEQVLGDGRITIDFGEILSRKELLSIIMESFPNTNVRDGLVYGVYEGNEYCIYFKNISYLGTPHPTFKKRVQIPKTFLELYDDNRSNNITTLLVGVYKYKETVLFCDFDTEKYLKNSIHNSSAHVLVNDLIKGLIDGVFQKTDTRGNIITVFDSDSITLYLKNKFKGEKHGRSEIVNLFDNFFLCIDKVWEGIKCYDEMIKGNFTNKFQAEWPGFYLEFKLQEYIEENDCGNIIKYLQNKNRGAIDLDLYFKKIKCYGDLKAHSKHSTGIQGNDYDTIMNLLLDSSVYYIICEHTTEKDMDLNYEVTEYWNSLMNKENLRSYGKRMKNKVTLTNCYILELNRYNKDYIDVFFQGKNSDGSARKPKIMIKTRNLDNFLIHSFAFN